MNYYLTIMAPKGGDKGASKAKAQDKKGKEDAKDKGAASGKAKGAQSVNVRHILVCADSDVGKVGDRHAHRMS